MNEPAALVLEVLKQGDQLAVGLFAKEALVSTVRHYSQLDFSVTENNKLCQEARNILNKADRKGNLEPDTLNALKKIGLLLWDRLFTRQIKERLKAASSQDLVLFLDEELIHIPWELIFDGKDFLCLKFNLGRLIRTKEGHIAPPAYRGLKDKLEMLILANPTNDLKSAYLEGLQIKNQFDKFRKYFTIDFKSTSIDTIYAKKNLRDYDIVHFAGHCEYDADNYKNSGWVFRDGRFTVQDIFTLGESLALPLLVFSNACQSAQGYPEEAVDTDYQKKTYNLASAFLFSGVRHYIGTIRRIEDTASFTFAKEFYAQLISGKSVGECLRLARLRLVKEYGLTAISWTSYLLYGDPAFILFKTKIKHLRLKFKLPVFLSKKRLTWFLALVAVLSLGIYLYMWLPTLNPSTYALFLRSRQFFGQGKNREVIVVAKQIIQKEPAFLNIYPLIAEAEHKLGQRELALKYYFDYALYSEQKKEVKHLASAYLGIGWIYQLQADYARAFDFYQKALALSREKKDILNEATALRRLAEWYADKGEPDKALQLLTKSSEINRMRLHIYEHKYNLACDYFDIGLVFSGKGDLGAAKEFYDKSRVLFEKLKLKNELSDCYFNLGEIYLSEKQYQKALDYYLAGQILNRP